MITINSETKLFNLNRSESEYSIAQVAIDALTYRSNEDARTSEEVKLKRWEMAKKFQKGGKLDLSEEDVKMLTELVCKRYPVTTYGSFMDALKGDGETK